MQLYCTDCESHIALAEGETRCGCGSGRIMRIDTDDPRADHDDLDDGEVRCAGCKAILNLDSNGALDHQCPSL